MLKKRAAEILMMTRLMVQPVALHFDSLLKSTVLKRKTRTVILDGGESKYVLGVS